MINFLILVLIYIVSTFYIIPIKDFFLKIKKKKIKPILNSIIDLFIKIGPLCFLFLIFEFKVAIIAIITTFVITVLLSGVNYFVKGILNRNDNELLVPKVQFIFFIMIQFSIMLSFYILTNIIFPDLVVECIESYTSLITYATSFLLLVSPCSFLIEMFFKSIVNVEEGKEETEEAKVIDYGNAIGVVERLLIFFLLFSSISSFLSIAAVLTAKTWARSTDIKDDPTFRVRYLAGTFLSFLVTLLIYFVIFGVN